MLSAAVCVLLVVLSLALAFRRRSSTKSLDHIPGPNINLWNQWKVTQSIDPQKQHVGLAELRRKYGPIFKFSVATFTRVIVSDYESIYQVMVKSGKDFGGRPTSFRLKEVLAGSGILFSYKNDATWKTLRKVSQKHLRQFGDGLSKIESVISEVAEDMFSEFSRMAGKPLDPAHVIFDTSLNSIAFLITGQRTRSGDRIVEDMREYEDMLLSTASIHAPYSFMLLNIFPWFKGLGFDRWPRYQRFKQLHNNIWRDVKRMHEENPESESIYRVLQEHIHNGDGTIREVDAQSAALSLLFAGVTTTSATFHAGVNLLAHYPRVQERIFEEIERVMEEKGRTVNLTDRPTLPYTRATLYELLRYTSVVVHGVNHRTLKDTQLGSYRIPADTLIETSIWNLHHDQDFWDEPYEFQPERFLDENGDVLPADHPNRTHLMPFGAGIRVCLGESLAMARLFIWVATLVSRFEITPAPGNKKSSTDARNSSDDGVLKAMKYEVIFKERKLISFNA